MDPHGIIEDRDESWEVELGRAGLGYLGDLRGDHVVQVHVYLYNNTINKAGPVDVEIIGVGGMSEVGVREGTPSLSESGHVLPRNLPWGSLSVQNEMTPRQVELDLNGLVVRVGVEKLGKGRMPLTLI